MHRRDLLTSGLLAASALASRSFAAGAPRRDDATPAATAKPADAATPPLITVLVGTLPIIITAPHGGLVRVPGSTGRTGGEQVTDVNTAEVALLIAQRLTAQFEGQQPSVIIAQFSRKDADANRPAVDAYENDAARVQYEAFHAAVRAAVDRIAKDASGKIITEARGLLLDIHGQVRVPEAIVRGTQDGRTVSRVISRAGIESITGPKSVFGLLKTAGNTVLPSLKPAASKDDQLDERLFDGGYIVGTYGSHLPDGIDAIQIEIGAQRSNNLLKCSRDIADAAEGFWRNHMMDVQPAPPRPAPSK
jgi:hypothetical protein